MIIKLGTWLFETIGGKAIATSLGLLALIAAWQVDRAAQRTRGATTAISKVKENNHDAASQADAAGRASRAGGGVLNPYYRDGRDD